jgi:hypothetical protein
MVIGESQLRSAEPARRCRRRCTPSSKTRANASLTFRCTGAWRDRSRRRTGNAEMAGGLRVERVDSARNRYRLDQRIWLRAPRSPNGM